MTKLQAAKKLLRKVKARQTSNFAELIIKGNLVEFGLEDPCAVTIEVDSIGLKWITGYVQEFGFISKFAVSENIEMEMKV